VRKAEALAGNRMTREAKAGVPKGDGKGITRTATSWPVVSNRPDTGSAATRCGGGARPEREPTRVR